MKIRLDGKYSLVGGEPVRIICTDRKCSEWTCIGLYSTPVDFEGIIQIKENGDYSHGMGKTGRLKELL